ncbi:MAG: DUF3187 family protein [Planctomycetota bacterium]
MASLRHGSLVAVAAHLAWPILALCLLAHPAAADDDRSLPPSPADWGLLAVRTQAPLYSARLAWTPGIVAVLPRGSVQIDASITEANVWGNETPFLFDYETTRFTLQLRAGLGDGWDAGLELAVIHRHGGFLDALVEDFHNLIGELQLGRDQVPRNRVHIELRDSLGTRIVADTTATGLADPVLRLRRELTPLGHGQPSLVAGLEVKVPIGGIDSGTFATSGFDFLFQLGLQIPVVRWLQIFIVVGAIWSPGSEQIYTVPVSNVQKFGLIGFELRISRQVTLMFHYLRHDGVAQSLSEHTLLAKSSNEFVGGVKWSPDGVGRVVLEAAFIENGVHESNVPDFGLHIGVRVRID